MLNRLMVRYRGLLVLVLWQAVPVGTDPYGRTRIGFGFGAGTIEFSDITCEGEVLESQTVSYRTVGANLEHWIAPGRALLRASGGFSSSDTVTLDGPFGALTISWEGQRFGIGGGLAIVPDYDETGTAQGTATMPSGYIRGGNRDKLHVRMELFSPSQQTHVVPFTLLIGYNQFGRGKPSGAFGFGLIGTDDPLGGVVGEGFFPVSRKADLGIQGFASPGREHAQAGAALQVRFTLN